MKAFIQFWEESELGCGVRPDGCSLHLEEIHYKKFIKSVYSKRDNVVPNEYDRIKGDLLEVEISKSLFDELLLNDGSLRLPQHSTNNLINFGEIKLENELND
jgi:hypothetical protein